ncbi:MAG: thioredoxin [Verrucomicrobiales bacterium]|nr:thioredoxin [Verrucomicrobiales bacterium]
MKNNIPDLTEANFETEVLQATLPVVVDFYAPWCGPCKMIAPLLENLAEQFTGRARVVKVNVDEAPSLAMRYDITGVPTLMLFRGTLVLDTFVGLPNPRALVARLEELAGSSAPVDRVNPLNAPRACVMNTACELPQTNATPDEIQRL